MKKRKTSSLNLDLQVVRNLDREDEGETDLVYVEFWKRAKELLATRQFIYEGNCEVRLDTDWTPVLRYTKREYTIHMGLQKALKAGQASEYLNRIRFPRGSIRVNCMASALAKRGKTPKRIPISAMLEAHVYDVFLLSNIAAPGSFTLSRAIVKAHGERFWPEIALEPIWFEVTCKNTQRRDWYAPRRNLPTDKVCDWYFGIRAGLSQVPQTRMEKVLFGLLHLSKSELSPQSIIWIFYVLETLLDTKAGENFQSMIRRIRLLLPLDEQQGAQLRKKLREMYDLRSAFVHGGLDVIHPMHNETLDRAVDERYQRLMDSADFGFALLLRTLQEVIDRGLRDPQFEEVLRDR